jgi:hypothetical protein
MVKASRRAAKVALSMAAMVPIRGPGRQTGLGACG